MDFVEQIKKWCREGEEDLRHENRLFAYAQLHAQRSLGGRACTDAGTCRRR